MGGWGFQMLMFANMGRPNADLSENRIKGKTYLFSNAKKNSWVDLQNLTSYSRWVRRNADVC